MSTHAAHTRWWQIFEVIFGIPFLAAIALQQVLPLAFPPGLLMPAMIIDIALIVLGVALVVLTRRQFAQYHQPTDPGQPTQQIMTTGVFWISRNPLYLGGMCVLLGVALAVKLPWALILLLPSLIACHFVLIEPEERYLAARFGEEYRSYAATVHRWIGRSG